jgi:predicted N-formylglutamate amidohydrolase
LSSPEAAPDSTPGPGALLGPDDPPPVTRRSFGRRFPAVLACDHASRALPRALGSLGLGEPQLARHIAWDIGAGALAEALARRLELPLVCAGYSRLVIDCNRRLEDPTSIVAASDGDRIPGNLALDAAERTRRAREIFVPYHVTLAAALEHAGAESGLVPALVAIHSFTDVFAGRSRPWHCGVLWDRDPRLALPLLEALRAEPGLVVGDNEPYSGRHPADYTVDTHGERLGRPHVCIEVRQDLLAQPGGVGEWAGRLGRILESLLSDPGLYRAITLEPR